MAKVGNINTTSVRDAIRLGCRTIGNVLNADDNYFPFFGAVVRPDAYLEWGLESDIPGRHLDALLNAEDAAGVAADEDVVEKEAGALFFTYTGPVALPLHRDKIDGPLFHLSPHMPRQSIHGLCALVKYRGSAKARELAERTIAAIVDLWDPEKGWDRNRIERLGLNLVDCTFITGIGRAIGPLVEYFKATGYAPALDLAVVLKDRALRDFFTEAGTYAGALFGYHCHSATCVMSSLAQLADLTRDASLMKRVKCFYDNGLWDIRDEVGWVLESSRPDADPDRGEGNNTGDVIETALILGRWGYTEYYEDAERILRSHLLPSQLRDNSFIKDPPNPGNEDGKRDVARRHLGAFGFPAPYGHAPLDTDRISFNMDIVGGVVGSLCEVYRELTRFDRAGHWVNLLFDHETDAIQVESPYTHRCFRVRVKRPGPLFVRLPFWVDEQSLEVTGITSMPRRNNGYLLVAEPPVDSPISIAFPLPVRDITLKHRTRDIRTRLRGDEVVAMDNFGADLTFFDPYEG